MKILTKFGSFEVTEDKKDPKIIYVSRDGKTYISPFISLHHTKDYLSRLGITESFKCQNQQF